MLLRQITRIETFQASARGPSCEITSFRPFQTLPPHYSLQITEVESPRRSRLCSTEFTARTWVAHCIRDPPAGLAAPGGLRLFVAEPGRVVRHLSASLAAQQPPPEVSERAHICKSVQMQSVTRETNFGKRSQGVNITFQMKKFLSNYASLAH